MNDEKISLVLVFYALGLGFIAWGLWGYDPRLAMISVGIGFVLVGKEVF